MTTEKIEDYHIRNYRPGDERAIVELFGVVFGGTMTESRWRWKYTGTGVTSPLAQLAFDPAGRLVGHAGAIPLRGWRRGQPSPFFQVCDVMVHPGARGRLGGQNLFTQLARTLLAGLAERWPEAFAYGFPGRRPFQLGEYARVYGEVERAVAVRRPARLGGWPLMSVQPLAWDDARLDRLWAGLASGFALALIRDRDYLRWRYATHPVHAYQLLGLRLGTRLLGWAVARRESERWLVVDLLLRRCWLRLALAALDRAALASGVSESVIWLPRGWREVAGESMEPTEVVVTHMVWASRMPTVEVRDRLYYTMGDLDIF